MGNHFGMVQPADILYPKVNKIRVGSYIKGFNVYKKRSQLPSISLRKSEEKELNNLKLDT